MSLLHLFFIHIFSYSISKMIKMPVSVRLLPHNTIRCITTKNQYGCVNHFHHFMMNKKLLFHFVDYTHSNFEHVLIFVINMNVSNVFQFRFFLICIQLIALRFQHTNISLLNLLTVLFYFHACSNNCRLHNRFIIYKYKAMN